MNIKERDILNSLLIKPFINQRILAEETNYSLGVVNKSVKSLIHKEYIDELKKPTLKALKELEKNSPKNAIILAAGFGMRMVPINTEISKGLIEINGERIIERLIKQLHEVGIKDIYVIVGFMKEKYEYLIDKYNVRLIINSQYATKNNLHSIKLVTEYLSNSYIIPCDIWCRKNPFSNYELYSWYLLGNDMIQDSEVRVNRKMDIVRTTNNALGNSMIGIAYITNELAGIVKTNIELLCQNHQFENAYWEESLFKNNRMILKAKLINMQDIVEINTYEQLREIDSHSRSLESLAVKTVCEVLNTQFDKIKNIIVLKKGMTNRSFLFEYKNNRYIMRIPGEGTDQLINRAEEYEVYQKIKSLNICDDIIYMNPENGYKITKFIPDARTCDISKTDDLIKCMKFLRKFHELKIDVNHTFDMFSKIEFYESLRGDKSLYCDYQETKKNVFKLKYIIDRYPKHFSLTHIDAVPDNFLIYEENGFENTKLIDWEYAAMQDPHVDIAMFCIYAIYDRIQVDQLIDIYFENNCPNDLRIKIYCYIAVCGLLWSNWCEYKHTLGIEFGEYSLAQYRYAKEYYKIVQEELRKIGEKYE